MYLRQKGVSDFLRTPIIDKALRLLCRSAFIMSKKWMYPLFRGSPRKFRSVSCLGRKLVASTYTLRCHFAPRMSLQNDALKASGCTKCCAGISGQRFIDSLKALRQLCRSALLLCVAQISICKVCHPEIVIQYDGTLFCTESFSCVPSGASVNHRGVPCYFTTEGIGDAHL